ncbi:MAG: hypothetical protein HY673_10570 [Chloroflexi bacterium]|nr:hypothetical protein [Chloroflexota bacterium]
MELRQHHDRTSALQGLRLSDPKTDIFLAANFMDAVLTYLALQHGGKFIEFNYFLYTSMNKIGVGPTLFLKLCFAIIILWLLRKHGKEYLLVPLSVAFAILALANLWVMRSHGVEI